MDSLINEVRKEIWLYKSGFKEKIDFWDLMSKFNELHYTLKDIQDIAGAGIAASTGEGTLEKFLASGEDVEELKVDENEEEEND